MHLKPIEMILLSVLDILYIYKRFSGSKFEKINKIDILNLKLSL